MNHALRGLFTALLATVLIAGNPLSVAAKDRTGHTRMVLPTGSNAGIEYLDGADSFFIFTNIMPGDRMTQTIEIQNRRNETVEFYLLADDSSAENDLLQHIGITIKNNSNGQILYKGNLTGKAVSVYHDDEEQNTGQTNEISLGRLSPKETAHFAAEITVPLEIDNEYADRISKVTWNIRAQIPDPAPSGSGQETNRRDTDREHYHSVITDEDKPINKELYTVPSEQSPREGLPRTGGRYAPCFGAFAILLAISLQFFRKKNTCRRFHPL